MAPSSREEEEIDSAQLVITGLPTHLDVPESLPGGNVGEAIFALLETYNARSHDVYRSMPRRARKLVCHSDTTRLQLVKALLGSLRSANAIGWMNDIDLAFQDLPSDLPTSAACIYHLGYGFPDFQKGYVGRTNDLADREKHHKTDVNAENSRTAHYEQAKGHTSRKITVICKLAKEADLGLGLDELQKLKAVENSKNGNQLPGDEDEKTDDQALKGIMGSIQIIGEQVCADLFGSYAPDSILQHQPLGLRQRNRLAQKVATHVLSLVDWIPILDRDSGNSTGKTTFGLNSILPWIPKTLGSNNRWTKMRTDIQGIGKCETYECKVNVYKRYTNQSICADLISYRDPNKSGECIVALGKARRGLDFGKTIDFVIEKLPEGQVHPHAYVLPAGIDILRRPDYAVLPTIAFRADWLDGKTQERDYIIPAQHCSTNERADKVLDILRFLDGHIDNQHRFPVTLMEQSFDVDSQQTVVTLRLQSLEARSQPPPSPLNIDLSAAMSDLGVSIGSYTVNPPQDKSKYRQGFGERIAKACDRCLLGGKPKVNKQGAITTFVPVGQLCTVNEYGKGCKRCSEHQLVCTATSIEILRNDETVRSFLAPPICVSDAGFVKFDGGSMETQP